MKPRILINVAFFALLGTILSVWAITTLIHLDAVDRPFHVTADFADSPGLHPDLEVTHLGVRVGKVGSVRLEPGKVDVRLDIDRDAKVPENVEAQVLRKSAVGEPYIELSLPQTGPAPRSLAAGDHIPIARTTATVQYKQLFDGVGTTLRAIDPQDAKTIVHELATGLEGRADSIHDLVGDAHQLTQTLAANSGLLDQLSVELTQLTHTVAGKRTELASGINDLAVFTASMRESRKDLEKVLAKGPAFMGETYQLLQKARPSLDCALDAAATQSTPIFTPETSRGAQKLLRQLPTFKALADDVIEKTPKGAYVRTTLLLTLSGAPAPAEFTSPLPKPSTGDVPRCATTAGAKAAKQSGSAAGDAAGGRSTTAGKGKDGGSDVAIRNADGRAQAAPSLGDRLMPLLPILLAIAILLGAGVNTLRVLRRRNGTLHRS